MNEKATKKFMLAAFVGSAMLAALAGCQTEACQRGCGFHFEVLKPPTITVATPVLVQGGSSLVGAHPIGTVAGPVVQGEYQHAPAAPAVPVVPRQPTPATQPAFQRMQPIMVPAAPPAPRRAPANNCMNPCAAAEPEKPGSLVLFTRKRSGFPSLL